MRLRYDPLAPPPRIRDAHHPRKRTTMKILSAVTLLSFALAGTAFAQETNLTRSEVAAIKAKLVTVQQAMGGDPVGYVKESEDFGLPTESNPAQGGRFWPITSSVQMRFTDRATKEGVASAEDAANDFQARYLAAVQSGNFEAITKMTEEMTRIQTAATAAAMNPAAKEPMQVYVQLNMNPTVGIDPDAVVLERSGVIALRRNNSSGDGKGEVTVYLDPVALKATEELSKIELRTADNGMPNKTGVYHLVIQLNGTLADIESWVQSFNFAAMLGVIDPR
jgi:hypothetical protein